MKFFFLSFRVRAAHASALPDEESLWRSFSRFGGLEIEVSGIPPRPASPVSFGMTIFFIPAASVMKGNAPGDPSLAELRSAAQDDNQG
jgi:hypothetical protein